MKLTKPIIAALAAGTLAVAGVGAWLALPAGTGGAAPAVQLPSANAALDVATPTAAANPAPDHCVEPAWPAAVAGRPAGDVPGGSLGYYLWHDTVGVGWHLEVTHPTTDHVVFSGYVTSDGALSLQRVDDEKNDYTHIGAHGHTMSFVFNNYGAIDGVHFETRCATELTFHLFVDAIPAGISHIVVGARSLNPLENPFTIDRNGLH